RIAEAVDHSFSVVSAYEHLGALYSHQGDVEKAIPVLERALAIAQAAEIRLLLAYNLAALGFAYARAGRIGEGLPLLEQGVEVATSSLRIISSLAVIWLSEAYLLAGRVQDAQARAARALTLARERMERGNEAWLLRLHGEIAVHADPPE